MEKGHYGEYSGNAKHSRVTASNYKASERDDAAHIDYLKRDVLYDNHHSHSDAAMTADEKHISHLAGDMKYDKKHHGMSRLQQNDERTGDETIVPLTAQEQFDQANTALENFNDSPDGRRIQHLLERGINAKERDSLINIRKPLDNAYDESFQNLNFPQNGPSRESSELKYMPIEDDMKRGMSRESSELKYMPIEDDMKRGMSRKEDLNAKALRKKVENYPRPMPANAPRQFTEQAYKRLGRSYANEGNVGMPTDEYVQSKYEEYRDGSTGSQTAPGFEARDGMSRKGSKPDYIDIDGDGNKNESMKKASDGMSRKSRSERLRGRAVKVSERSGEGQGGYDYENPRVMNMLNRANMLDERSGAFDKKGAKKGRDIGGFLVDERSNELRDNEVTRMMDERSDGMNRMSKYGGNKHDYHRHMDAQGHMTKDGVVGGGKYGKGGHYKDYEGMSRDSYGMERKSCGTKYTGVSRYSSPAAFMGIKRPGRCTPFPNPDCEPGTPQYNLAKRLKPGGDLYKGKKK